MPNDPKLIDSPYGNTDAAGPGAFEVTTDAPKPLLEGASEYEYIDILNPLSVDFIGQFGVTKPANAPIEVYQHPDAPGVTRSEADLRNNYGLDLKNRSHPSHMNIINRVKIPSGKTIRVLGNEAQILVLQLVNEIMQRQGQKLLLADPFARNQVEKTIIMGRGKLMDVLGHRPQTVQEQLQNAIKEPEDEQAFPEVSNPRSQRPSDSSESNPPAGHGVNYDPGYKPYEIIPATDPETDQRGLSTEAGSAAGISRG